MERDQAKVWRFEAHWFEVGASQGGLMSFVTSPLSCAEPSIHIFLSLYRASFTTVSSLRTRTSASTRHETWERCAWVTRWCCTLSANASRTTTKNELCTKPASRSSRSVRMHFNECKCTHALVAQSYKSCLHWDAGAWDDDVMAMVNKYFMKGNTHIRADLLKTIIFSKNVQYIDKVRSFLSIKTHTWSLLLNVVHCGFS